MLQTGLVGAEIAHVLCLLTIVIEWQVMNEIALHRGSSPHLNTIDIYVDGQHLTEAVVRVPLCV